MQALEILFALSIIFAGIMNFVFFLFGMIEHSVNIEFKHKPKYKSITTIKNIMNTKKCILCYIARVIALGIVIPFYVIGRGLADVIAYTIYVCWIES